MQSLTLKTYWGRYLIFSVVSLVLSLTVFTVHDSEYPDQLTHWFFVYFGSHLLYWGLYVILYLQFMMAKKSSYSFGGYMNSVCIMLAIVAIVIIVFNLYAAFKHVSFDRLNRIPFALVFALASYNLYLNKEDKS